MARLGPADLPALVAGRIAEEGPQRANRTAMTDAEKPGALYGQHMGAPVQDDRQPAGLAELEPQQPERGEPQDRRLGIHADEDGLLDREE